MSKKTELKFPMAGPKSWRLLVVAGLLGSLGACATKTEDLPPAPNVILVPGHGAGANLPTPTPHYKLGKPYKVAGIWYYPKDEPNYERQGVASWYGPKFHGRLTANGELFDMNRLSAAHPSLPLPSLVEVTNMDNGKSVVVRVNDRGPFAHGRLIDLSRAAAEELGYRDKGLANVKVRYLSKANLADAIVSLNAPENPRSGRLMATSKAERDMTTVAVRVASGPEDATIPQANKPPERGPVVGVPVTITNANLNKEASSAIEHETLEGHKDFYLVQVGAFSSAQNANQASIRFADSQPVRMSRLKNNQGRALYHVRLGPFTSRSDAEQARAEAVAAGFDDARIFKP